VVQAVGVTSFITASQASQKAKKTATLLKSLTVNTLIMGELGVGKESLATFILPDAPIVDASSFDELLATLESSNEIIITNIDNSPNIKRLVDAINLCSIRVVATSKQTLDNELIDDLFSIKLEIPPLRDRIEDVSLLIKEFNEEASVLFGKTKALEMENFVPDLSQNALSLKRQVMIHYLLHDLKDVELMELIQNHLQTRLGSNDDYRKFLYLYEVPLIKAGIHKFKSQLQLSSRLGLNRNTLRKKIAENKQYL
jgi:DNA-binding NtrC family response regulator